MWSKAEPEAVLEFRIQPLMALEWTTTLFPLFLKLPVFLRPMFTNPPTKFPQHWSSPHFLRRMLPSFSSPDLVLEEEFLIYLMWKVNLINWFWFIFCVQRKSLKWSKSKNNFLLPFQVWIHYRNWLTLSGCRAASAVYWYIHSGEVLPSVK